jgi:hypothetical protein
MVEQREIGAFEVEYCQLSTLPGLQEAPDLQVAVGVDELIVDGQRNQVPFIAFIQHFVHVPHSQVHLSLRIPLSAVEEVVVSASEEPRHCRPVHLLLHGLEWLVGARLVEAVLFGRELDHVGNADAFATNLAPQLPSGIPNVLVPETLKEKLRPLLPRWRLKKVQLDANDVSRSIRLADCQQLSDLPTLRHGHGLLIFGFYAVLQLGFSFDLRIAHAEHHVLTEVLQLVGGGRSSAHFVELLFLEMLEELSHSLWLLYHLAVRLRRINLRRGSFRNKQSGCRHNDRYYE